MITMPIYDMIMLPGITFYFKNDIFQKLNCENAQIGEDILFIMLKSDKERDTLTV